MSGEARSSSTHCANMALPWPAVMALQAVTIVPAQERRTRRAHVRNVANVPQTVRLVSADLPLASAARVMLARRE